MCARSIQCRYRLWAWAIWSISVSSMPPLGCHSSTNAWRIARNWARCHGESSQQSASAARWPLTSSSYASALTRSQTAHPASGFGLDQRRQRRTRTPGRTGSLQRAALPFGIVSGADPAVGLLGALLQLLHAPAGRSPRRRRRAVGRRLPISASVGAGAATASSSLATLDLPDQRADVAPGLAGLVGPELARCVRPRVGPSRPPRRRRRPAGGRSACSGGRPATSSARSTARASARRCMQRHHGRPQRTHRTQTAPSPSWVTVWQLSVRAAAGERVARENVSTHRPHPSRHRAGVGRSGWSGRPRR